MSMADRDGKIWMDGALVDWRDAKIHVLTHTLHYGCGAFEGVRAYNTVNGTAIFRLQEHTQRLFNSAKILRMKIPFSFEEVFEAQRTVVRENKLESCYLRPLTWIGSEKLGVSPKGNTVHLMVAAWPWGAYLGEEGMRRGIRVKTSSYTRHHVNITMTQAKAVSNYTNSILANMEALDDGYDEAMLLDASGFVSEGRGREPLHGEEGVVYTPDLSAGALDGITRNTILAICSDLGLKLVEKRITRDEVYICDEAFFTGTAAEVTPIRELDRVELGSGQRGPITEKIQSAFFDIVNGRNPEVRRMADQGLNAMATGDPRKSAVVELLASELQGPGVVFCPNPKMPLWSNHPRVFIDVAPTGLGQVPVLRHRIPAQGGREGPLVALSARSG
jgi:branched-chain amino acid aminotransferase